MKLFFTTFLTLILFSSNINAQTGIIKGRVFDVLNNEPIIFCNVIIAGSTIGTTTDENGNYSIGGLEPGLYNIEVSYISYKTKVMYEIEVTNSKPAITNVPLTEDVESVGEVVVQASAFNKTEESPVSLRTIGVSEISRNPGGGRDISKVIQSLPGVTTASSFRNDLLIRGGAPNENRF